MLGREWKNVQEDLMNQARSGELDVELGHQRPNANKACRKSDNALRRIVTLRCHCRSCDSPCVTRPTPLRLVGPRTVAAIRT